MASGIAAIANAKSAPINKPNKIPRGTDFTLRAKSPINTPPTRPLNDEPRIIVIISGRTSGVSQADAPSSAPSSVPSNNPSRILFIANSSAQLRSYPEAAAFSLALTVFTTGRRISLDLTVKKVEDQEPHH